MSITCGRGVSPPSPRAPRRRGGGARDPPRLRGVRSREQLSPPLLPTAFAAATSAFGSRIRNPCAGLTMKQSSNVPAFLSKLWTLVEETHTNEFITWSQVRSGSRWPRVPLVEPARLGSARLDWVELGWAGLGRSRGLRRRAASPPRVDPRLCVRREPGPAGSVCLGPRAVGEGRPGNGPAGPGSSEPARAARSAHSSSVVSSPRGAEVTEPGERASGRAWGLSKEITSAGIACPLIFYDGEGKMCRLRLLFP